MIADPEKLPFVDLPDGMKITLLSPYHEQLQKLKPVWLKEVIEAGLMPGNVEVELPDDSAWVRLGGGCPK
ncbi:hypothetical protein MKQ70_32200 [Chitinophaga sedimenti]|uniref:hypothetical protein n=1 Tax=Chitinophaga sedimenti TaxID=2033606 RepID=UPI002002BF04|nr:hypothetical protein [Chitinophaga sedimenti]MCK7559380.1 hypothetical protein [Chitinophaga sedimenti]